MRNCPTGRADPLVFLGSFFTLARNFLPSSIQFRLVFEPNRGVIERSFNNAEFGLHVSFAIHVDEQLAFRFGRIDPYLHRFAGLVNQLPTAIQRFDSEPVNAITLGLELELTLLAIGFRSAFPSRPGVFGDFQFKPLRWSPNGTEFKGNRQFLTGPVNDLGRRLLMSKKRDSCENRRKFK